jgi:hypothetical protein
VLRPCRKQPCVETRKWQKIPKINVATRRNRKGAHDGKSLGFPRLFEGLASVTAKYQLYYSV